MMMTVESGISVADATYKSGRHERKTYAYRYTVGVYPHTSATAQYKGQIEPYHRENNEDNNFVIIAPNDETAYTMLLGLYHENDPRPLRSARYLADCKSLIEVNNDVLEVDENGISWIYYVEYREYRKWPEKSYGELSGDIAAMNTTLAGAKQWVADNAAKYQKDDIPHEFWILAEPVNSPQTFRVRLISRHTPEGVLIYDFESDVEGEGRAVLNGE